MFNNLKAKKRITQVLVAFVVLCISVTGSFLLLEDAVDSVSAATKNVNVSTASEWNTAMSNAASGDIINVTLTGSPNTNKLNAIPAGVTVNLNMNNNSIYYDLEASNSQANLSTSYPLATTYWGLITNNGTLNITGTGTIRMKAITYNIEKKDDGIDDAGAKACAIVNAGDLTIGSGITVSTYLTIAANSDDSSGTPYWDLFLYCCSVYNEGGTVTTSGKINSGVFGGNTAHSGSNSYTYTFAYGIYGGEVLTKGGSINVDALAGNLMATSTCEDKNQIVAMAIGSYSNKGIYMGDTTINTNSTTWDSPGGYDAWDNGDDISFSAGVMYTTTNYPVIGASVDVNAKFICPGENDTTVYIPGGNNLSYTVRNKSKPGEYARRAYPVVGVDQNQYTIGNHTAEKTWGECYFGSGPDTNAGLVNQYFNFYDNMYYYPENAYYEGATGSSYRVNASSLYEKEAGANSAETKHKQITNGVPGTAGTQYVIVYRYYTGSVSPSNLQSVSLQYDKEKLVSKAIMNVANVASNTNGVIDPAGSTIKHGSGGVSQNEYYYYFASLTCERVETAAYANRSVDYENKKVNTPAEWSANGTSMTDSGTTGTTANTIVMYMNYILKEPTYVRVAVASATSSNISFESTGTSFSATYTGAALVPGTDFKIGIIDMGVDTDASSNDTSDDTLVTSVYDITGSGSGSGNNATAVTYKYSSDGGTNWTDGLPRDRGSYKLQINIYADTTFASSGTYNRAGAQYVVDCDITQASVSISGDSTKKGTYGSTYADLIPFADYTATPLGGDTLNGTWSFAGVSSSDYPAVGSKTVTIVWTPTAGTTTANNYKTSTFDVTLDVAARAVTVDAGNISVVYGDADPVYTVAYTNLADCDSSKENNWLKDSVFEIYYSGAWVEYYAGLPVGTYDLRIKTFGGAEDTNNKFTLNNATGSLAITDRSIYYTAAATDRAYNGSDIVDVTLTYVSGVFGTDSYEAIYTTTGQMTNVNAGENKNVTVITDGLTIPANYKLYIQNAPTVNISKATPTGVQVQANPANITYDSSKVIGTATNLEVISSQVDGSWAWKDASVVPSCDVASYTAVFTPADTVNYVSIEQAVALTVAQKEVVISVLDYQLSYGDAIPAVASGMTYTGFTGEDTINTIGITGQTEVTTTYKRGSVVGTYPVTITSTIEATNYFFTTDDGVITVNPKALTITANNASVVYGAVTPSFDTEDVTIEGFYGSEGLTTLDGTLTITTARVENSPVGTYDIVPAGVSGSNYAITFVNGTLEVTKATLTVAPTAQSVSYGADAPKYADNKYYTVTGFVAGDTASDVTITGVPAFSTGYVSGSNAGTYPVTVNVAAMSAENYKFTGVEGALTVVKATPNVTLAPDATVINSELYATAVFGTDGVVINPNKTDMTVAGTFTLKDASATATWADGSAFQETAIFTPADTNNYNTVEVEVWLDVLAKAISGIPVIEGSAMSGNDLTISFASLDPAGSQYYTIQWYSGGSAISGATSTTYAVQNSDIGKTIYVVLTAREAQGFTGSAQSSETSVVIEALTAITIAQLAHDELSDVEYDSLTHAIAVSVASGYNDDQVGAITVKYNGSTDVPVSAGTYIVTVDVDTPAKPSGGYVQGYHYGPISGLKIGEFTITRAPIALNIIANDKIYDGTTAATATVTFSGLKDEMDDVRIAEGPKYAFADASAGTDKTVTVTSMSLVGAQAANYKIDESTLTSTASITPRTIYYKAYGVTKAYNGSAVVDVTFTYYDDPSTTEDGYAAVDSASTFFLTNGSATAVSADAGTRILTNITATASGSSRNNYNYRIQNDGSATVEITKATPVLDHVTITGLTYNSVVTLASVDLSAYNTSAGYWQFNDDTIVPTVSQKEYAATYISKSSNYTNVVSTVTVDVAPFEVTLRPADMSIAYGSKIPTYKLDTPVFTGDDTINDISGTYRISSSYYAGADIGSYTVSVSESFEDANYTFVTEPGTLTVSPATLNVTATSVNKVYDGTKNITVGFEIVSGKYGSDDVGLTYSTVIGSAATQNAGTTTVSYIAPGLKGAKAGNYEIYVTPASGVLTVVIEKADLPGVIFPSDASIEFGYDLTHMEFGVPGQGDGSFMYKDAKTTYALNLGFNYGYEVVFTPSDARNYNTQSMYLEFYVTECVLNYVVGIAGTAQSGETLVVGFTGLPSQALDYINYQWYRVSSTGYTPIDGATSDSYVATDDDVGYTLLVYTYFEENDPFVFSEFANVEELMGETIQGIVAQTKDAIEEVYLSFWQRLLNWIRRIIEVITGVTLMM